MIGLDTNILARYYIAPANDDAAESRQCTQATQLIDSGQPLAVCKTVLLELEWVLRGVYGYTMTEIAGVFRHLLAQTHIEIEDRSRTEQALRNYEAGLDFADALQHASYGDCSALATFDDRGFARKGERLRLVPQPKVPGKGLRVPK